MKSILQIAKVLQINIRSLPSRWASSLVAIVGIAGVVAVFVTILSIANGLQETASRGGADDVLVIMGQGSGAELNSSLLNSEVTSIEQLENIARDTNNDPIVSPELYVIVDLKKQSTGLDANMPLRGVTNNAMLLRPNFKLIEGRMFTPGLNEIIVGKSILGNYQNLEFGSELKWGKNVWTVVGVFEDNGSAAESEIWTDSRVLQSAYNRNVYSTARLKAANSQALESIQAAIDADPKLNLTVKSEKEFLSEQTEIMNVVINVIGTALAVLMGIAASFGAINTMYTAVASRTREIATLRALGFGRGSIIFSVLTESIILGLLGGLLGGLLAYLFFNGFQVSTLSWTSFTQLAFEFSVSPSILVSGMFAALIIGIIGGLLPSIRAARIPISQALREL
ncbi:MAG: ABC transporter permease [Gammaproteobacteria bacterium]|nr:ABC transporter permease [Gammaproteobacteria bacterium]NNC98235.1 ABC transporter permease [Gammaproteobacteria bacterium]NNM14533.1 ABC transporter permease [Gammaproteobacteria bacterium]